MGISHRLKRLEHQVRALSGRDQEDARLRRDQQHSYEWLCEELGCTPEEVPYSAYVPVWRAASRLTLGVAEAASDAGLRWATQQHCPVVLPVLERFLQRPGRFMDPLWGLRHGLAFHNRNAYAHFLETLVAACHTVWPYIAVAWPTLGYAAQSWLLHCWLCVSDPAQCPWDETTTEEQKLTDLQAVLTRLYAEYNDVVLHACSHWHPGMCYPYKDDPAYVLQPSGWGLAGQPLGRGKSTPPLDDTAAAWQRHCAHQLTARWVAAATETAGGFDQTALLVQVQAPGAPDEASPHGLEGAQRPSAVVAHQEQRLRRLQCSEGSIHG